MRGSGVGAGADVEDGATGLLVCATAKVVVDSKKSEKQRGTLNLVRGNRVDGAACRIRTGDPLITNEMLYQLS